MGVNVVLADISDQRIGLSVRTLYNLRVNLN